MPAADDHQERLALTPDELLGGMAYEAATLLPTADTDLDRELAQLLADDRQRRPIRGIATRDPLPGC